MIDSDIFQSVAMHVGRIIAVEEFPEARKPAYKLQIDFGDSMGTRWSSAQITDRYTPQELHGRLVICVTNLPVRRIGPFDSEVLTLGVSNADGAVVLLQPDESVPLGSRVY